MNNALLEAKFAPATLEQREKGKAVLVRAAMITYLTDTCRAIDAALAEIPQLLQKYKLSDYDTEVLQRSILREGFAAVQVAVRKRTLDRLEKAGLFPKVRERLADENTEAIPQALRDELEATVREIRALNADLDEPVDLEALWFRSGKLRIYPKYYEAIAPRYTLAVTEKERKTVEKIREAACLLADLKGQGVQIGDEMRISPADGKPYLSPGLITRMAQGSGYTDAELLGLLHGIALTH